MAIPINDPDLKSWLPCDSVSDFPIQNIPFGVFLTNDDVITIGTRIGDYAIDLSALHQLGYFKGIELPDDVFEQDSLNDFIACGKETWTAVRNRIINIFEQDAPDSIKQENHKSRAIFKIADVEMILPVVVGDYTDFYSSKEHAVNVGKMFRDPENALLPNWRHMPIGYHGRSSSIITTQTNVRRPNGQVLINGSTQPVLIPSEKVDFELEVGFITSDGNKLGESIAVDQAEEHIFGMVLLNDWSARDIQRWEYVPLGPFLGKNFATSISPWIVTMDALEPYRCRGPQQDLKPLKYLQNDTKSNFDIKLEVDLQPEGEDPITISKSNFKYVYWSMAQQLAHHTINGCKVNSGDLMGSGTISGTDSSSFGSMLELSWNGKHPIDLTNGLKRSFVEDEDTIILRGYCDNGKVRIGFGELKNKLLQAQPID